VPQPCARQGRSRSEVADAGKFDIFITPEERTARFGESKLLEDEPPPVRVELVAYTLEEAAFGTPDMGSAVHARALRENEVPVRAMLSLEMLGTFTDEPGSQRFPTFLLRPFYPSTGNFIALVGRPSDAALTRELKRAMRQEAGLEVRSFNAPGWFPGVSLSDHASYWDQGYPALMVTDTALFRNPRYHLDSDTPDTLDYPRMAKVVEAVNCGVRALGEASTRAP